MPCTTPPKYTFLVTSIVRCYTLSYTRATYMNIYLHIYTRFYLRNTLNVSLCISQLSIVVLFVIPALRVATSACSGLLVMRDSSKKQTIVSSVCFPTYYGTDLFLSDLFGLR